MDNIEKKSQFPLLRANGVYKKFGNNEVLKGINLEVSNGEVVVIIGPSGSGKSTFLRCINQLEKLDKGYILVGDTQIGYELIGDKLLKAKPQVIAKQRSKIGMVFQQFNLYPHLTVLQNIIEAPIGVHKQSFQLAQQNAYALLEKVGLREKAKSYPSQLSGGQQQRVAIVRALAINPQLMLFDEPTSALDPELVGEVLLTMRNLAEQGLTMIIVTHEIGFAKDAADRVVFMDEGKIVESGSPKEVLTNPQNVRTRKFLSRFINS